MAGPLTDADHHLHAALGIDPAVLARAQVSRVTDAEARAWGLGGHGDMSGVLYPYLGPDGRAVTCRVRRDRPEMEDGKPKDKYLTTYGDRHHTYQSACAADVLTDAAVPLVPVEAEKSALMLASVAARTGRPLAPVALGGCWGWRGRIGKAETPDGARVDEKGMVPDLAHLITPGRIVVIWLDANVRTNTRVAAAERQLVRALVQRGAIVRVARIPDVPGVNGPDDYRGAASDAAVWQVIDEAVPAVVPCDSVADHLAYADLEALTVGVVPIDLEQRLHRLAESVRGKDAVRVRVVREAAVAALKAARMSGAAKLVDAALGIVADDADAGPAALLEDDAPSAAAVSGADLLDHLSAVVCRYVVLPSPAVADAIALWVLLAWCEAGVSILPLLTLWSPTKRCGKSTAMTVLGALLRKALAVSGISPAALFRSVEKWHPALLIDEADTLLPGNEDLRGVLNAGHTRHAATIIRCVGEDQEPTPFSVWCPKVLAMIGRPTYDTLTDRSILIELRRKTPAEQVGQLRQDTIHERLRPLRQQCRRWADDHTAALTGADPVLPSELHDRAADNWRSMVAIADLAGGDWPTRARDAAKAISGTEDDGDLPLGVVLLSDIRRAWARPPDAPIPAADEDADDLARPRAAWMATADLLEKLHAVEDRPWRAFGRTEKPLTGAKLARLLRPFGTAIAKERAGNKTYNAYHWHQVTEAITRYAPPVKAEQRNTPTDSKEESRSKAEQTSPPCSALETQNPLQRVAKFRCSALNTPPKEQEHESEEPEVVNAKYV